MTQRSRRSWALWRLRRIPKQLAREERRLLLLRVETDSQLLRVKELLLLQASLEHRELEQQQSLAWHQPEMLLLAAPPPPEPSLREKLDQVLGNSTP